MGKSGSEGIWGLATVEQLQAPQIPTGLREEGERILWTL